MMTYTPPPGLLKVPIGTLEIGMYIAAVDRPWLETPFAVQGFHIESELDIDFVAQHCQYVYIDPRIHPRGKYEKRVTPLSVPKNTTSLKSELRQANVDLESTSQAIEKVFKQVRANRHVDLRAMQKIVTPLIDSVLRNHEAIAALLRMKEKDNYFYQHCISTAVWAVLMGRHAGFDKDDLKVLVLGTFMIDIGMIDVPDSILQKKGELTDEERTLIHKHVDTGIGIVKQSGMTDRRVLEIIHCHHERFDGSGYPVGRTISEIPLTARIAGIADTYDAMMTPRPYQVSRSAFEATQELSDLKGTLFQPELIELFIQAIGIFPTGSIVELNTGEVGIVVAQNPTRRLKPQIIVVLNSEKQRYKTPIAINLDSHVRVHESGNEVWITKDLNAGSYGLDAANYFL